VLLAAGWLFSDHLKYFGLTILDVVTKIPKQFCDLKFKGIDAIK
jgi:hypothetical protein